MQSSFKSILNKVFRDFTTGISPDGECWEAG